MDSVKKVLIISSDKNLSEVLNFCLDGWGYEVYFHDSPIDDIVLIKRISPDIVVVDVRSAGKSQLEICRLIKADSFTACIPVIALINKLQLRTQLLNLKQGVDDYLIKPPDPLDLRIRIEMAIRRFQHSFHATPLTGLPGGRIIEDVLKAKIRKAVPFSFGYIDIDHFKHFNDAYGYAKGDKVIMQTAYILYTTVRKFGNPDDFIGHIGGDDFIFITTPDRHEDVCHNFILMFDKITPFHYSPKDRESGFVMVKDRTHKIKKIPLVSVSVALVNKTNASEFKNTIEINERIAEIKRYLKLMPGSKFMADRRDSKSRELSKPAVYQREKRPINSYRPLGQTLLEKKVVSTEQLDEALELHWRKGILLGEVLRELGFINENELKDALE